jgi:hypothetical protein
MKTYTNTFMGLTTIVVDVETTNTEVLQNIGRDLDSLAIAGGESHMTAQSVINTHDEDQVVVWRFIVLTNQNKSCIDSIINDLPEYLLEAAE